MGSLSSSPGIGTTGLKRMDKNKTNVLKASTRSNDCPSDNTNILLSFISDPSTISIEIQTILEHQVLNGVEYYSVFWKCYPDKATTDFKTTWETEKTIQRVSQEVLVKYWVKRVMCQDGSDTQKKNVKKDPNFHKKLLNWSREPFVSSKAAPLIHHPDGFSTSNKRPRMDVTDDEGICEGPEKKPMIVSQCSKMNYENSMLKSVPNIELSGELNDKFEAGEIIEYKQGSRSFLVKWSYVSCETAGSLGLNEKLLQNHFSLPKLPGTTKFQLQRKREANGNSATLRCFEGKHTSSNSDLSEDSTHPPSTLSDDLSPEPVPVKEEPFFDAHDIFDEEETEKVAVACQTDVELDPNVCSYCRSKRGERQRLSSLRQRTASSDEKEDNSKKSTDKTAKDEEAEDGDGAEDDDDMVDIEYEVEHIVDYRRVEGTNDDEYYIKWKGFLAQYNTWEPASNLTGCDRALIQFYTNRVGERKQLEAEHVKSLNQRVNGEVVSSVARKPLILPPMPPIPEFVMTLLSNAAPVTDAEIETAYKTSRTASKKSRWTGYKLRQVLLDMFGLSTSSNSQKSKGTRNAKSELPFLRHQLLMLEGERRKELILKDLKEWETKLNEIALCRPEIVVENNYDLARPPQDFKYINDNVIGENVHFVAETFEGCACEDSCLKDKSQCCPGKHSKVLAYNHFRRIRVVPGYPIYECNKRCKCGPECGNRVVQDGTVSLLGTKLCIFRTSNDRGWGVKTLKKIKRGTFVCLYAGEIITSEEAESRGQEYEKQLGASYLFDLDYYAADGDAESCPYTIDATQMGNISHFINHSCDPNLCVFNVWADCVDQNLPKLAFFALRDINKDEELTYDYGTQDPDPATPSLPTTSVESLVTAPILLPNGEPDPDDEMAEIDPALLSTLSPAKNRMKPATVSAARRPCLCGSAKCRKVLF